MVTPGAIEHAKPVDRFVRPRRVKAILRRPAAGGDERCRRLGDDELAFAHVEEQRAGYRLAGVVEQQFDRTNFFQHRNPPLHHLFGESAHDLDAGEITFVNRAIERLAGERFLFDCAVGIAIEEAAEFCLHLFDGRRGLLDERDGKILIVDVLPALERVHQVLFVRVFVVEHDVEPALHHPAASAFALERFGRDQDFQIRIGVEGVECGHLGGGAHANDQ